MPRPHTSLVARPLRHVFRLAGAASFLLLLAGCGGRDSEPEEQARPMARAQSSPPLIIVPAQSQPVSGSVAATPPPAPPETGSASPRTDVIGSTSPTDVATSLPPPPAPASTAASPTAEATPLEVDPFGFNADEYVALLTPDEVDILRLRARGDTRSHLAEHLTAREKENLRQRAAESIEIGVEPLRAGE